MYRILWVVCMFSAVSLSAQKVDRPKLVVGIVIDQMRYDYLYRYADKYGKDGFNRLLKKGANCVNAHINYIPTYTAPGHTCVYTGSVPAIHGIIGNDWYERSLGKEIYCTSDTSYQTIGAAGKNGQHSPRNLWATTITDELRLAQNFRNKTIAVAIKDRSSILPAGHSANAAYWLDGKSGNWISSTYYQPALPKWAADFNALRLCEKYLKEPWSTKLDIREYDQSTEDEKWYERTFSEEEKSTFPHKINELTTKGYDIIKASPSGNTYTAQMAKAALVGEGLGKGATTDFLAVSFSSTDYIGHQFGPNSIEMEDTYIRLDAELADFFIFLDKEIGKGKYTLFLTADHGAAHARGFSNEHHLPSDVFYHDSLKRVINKELAKEYGAEFSISSFVNMQLYFNETVLKADAQKRASVYAFVKTFLLKDEMVLKVVALDKLGVETLTNQEKELLQNGYQQKRSGDMQVIFKSAILEEFPKGTTHGTGFNYDTHIPLLFYGWGIAAKQIVEPVYMTDIAPTIATLLHIQEPSGCIGHPIEDIFED